MHIRKYLLVVLLLLFFINTKGQFHSTVIFNKITNEQGLSNSVVYDIIQDTNGFMWFTTKDGINRFDGSNIVKYTVSEHSYQYAKDNIVLCIEQSPQGDLYCATAAGRVYKYNPFYDKFEKLNVITPNPIISPVYDLLFADSTNLIVCSASGLFHLNLKTLNINYISGLNKIIQTAFRAKNGSYWIGTYKGVFHGNIDLNKDAERTLKRIDAIGKQTVYAINQDNNGNVWIGTRDNGVYVYNENSGVLRKLKRVFLNYYGRVVPVRNITFVEDKVIIALDGEGVCVLDSNFNIVKSYRHIDDDSESLSNNGVYDIYIAGNGSIWLATYGGGVNVLYNNREGFTIIRHRQYDDNSLRNNTARCFLETDDGKLWFGTKKGLSILDVSSGSWKHLSLNRDKHKPLIVLSLYQSDDGTVWAGAYKEGLFSIDPKNYSYRHVRRVDAKGNKVGTDYIYTVIADNKGRIWSGGILGHISVYDPQTGISREVAINNVKDLYESQWGVVYVGTTDGIYIVDTRSLKAERPKPYNIFLNQNRIYCVYGDKSIDDKQLWLGTEGGGLLLWDISNEHVKVFSINDGLPSNFIYGIEKDKFGKLWLSTTNGICNFDIVNGKIINYTSSDGLSDQEFNFGAYGHTGDGAIVFGGQHGFTFIEPEKIVTDTTIPPIEFNSFKLFGKEQAIGEEGSPLKRHINFTNHIYLKAGQNAISIGFSVINFKNPKKIKYMWMLHDFETEWSEPSYFNEAVYTNLPPGDYIFKVKASNQDGVWGNNERDIKITIAPYFSQTVWAYMLYALIIAGIFALIIHYNRIRTQEKHAIEKTRFFVNIAHDIRTPLTLVKAPLEQLTNSERIDKKDRTGLLQAKRNVDRLSRLVNQLMDFQKADLGKLQFAPAPYKFIEFFKETVESFSPLIEEKKLNIHFDLPENDFVLWFDKNKMEKIIFNLVSNAIKYTEKGGDISLTVKRDKEECFIIIEDTGMGIPAEQQKSIFTRYFRAKNVVNSQETGSGVGLILVKKLVELHGGTIVFESIEGEGTIFKINLPFKEYDTGTTTVQETESSIETVDEFESLLTDVQVQKHDKKRYKVLLVEDNNELLEYISGILSKYFEVITAQNGEEALDMIKDNHPDIIISDVMMPVMDGNQMCQLIKSNIDTCHIPVILLTALNSVEHKIDGLKVGADAYIEKPFDIGHLMAQVNNLLVTRKQLKDKFVVHVEEENMPEMYNPLDSELLDKSKAFILKNIMNNNLSVDMLTKELCMSRPVLYRKIKALTDQSPQDYIRLIRLVEAKKLLMNRSKSISDVAYETGFSDPKYFSTSFKKQFGVTPTQYIKEKKNKKEV